MTTTSLEILPVPRTTCLKCGDRLSFDAGNVGPRSWCPVCRRLLGLGGPPIDAPTMARLGITANEVMQHAEPVPHGRDVATWYEPEADHAPKFDRIFSLALRAA